MAAAKNLPINAKSADDAERIARDLFAKHAPAGTVLEALTLATIEPKPRPDAKAAATQPGATGCYVFAATFTKTETPKETQMTAKTATAKTATAKTAKTPLRANDASPILAAAVEAAITKVCGKNTRTPDAYCGKDLPLADFNKGSDKDGRDRLCKTCSAAWWAASKARSAAKKAAAPAKAEAKATTPKATTPKATTPKAKATATRRDPGARPAIADQADAKRAEADAARLARVKAAVAAAALAEQAAR